VTGLECDITCFSDVGKEFYGISRKSSENVQEVIDKEIEKLIHTE